MDRPDAAGPAGCDLVIRPAVTSDIESIVRLLADDPLGADREIAPDDGAPPDAVYVKAFAAIEADPNARVIVACRAEQVVGTLQLNLIAGLSRSGLLRGQIESVRVAASERGTGLGTRLFDWAIAECRAAGCGLVQLTTDRTRTDAHRFYERLGFEASHTGYKLKL